MDTQLNYYTETGGLRDEFDRGLSVMAAYTTFRKEVYQNGALSLKNKRLTALSCGLQPGCTRCVQGQTKDAIDAGAIKDEVLEAVSVAVVTGRTTVSAETWRVVKVL